MNQDQQPEPHVDPPSDTKTPVDHLEVAQTLLRDVEHELMQADIGNARRQFLVILIGALQDMLEVLR